MTVFFTYAHYIYFCCANSLQVLERYCSTHAIMQMNHEVSNLPGDYYYTTDERYTLGYYMILYI